MARWWTIKIPPEFKDVSLEANQEPELAAALVQRRGLPAEVEAEVYRNGTGASLFVMDTTAPKLATNKAGLDKLESAERGSTANTGKEISYLLEHTASLTVATQKATIGNANTLQKRWLGVATDDSTRILTVGCTGPDDVCEPILRTVAVDEAQFQTLASMKPPTSATDIGEMIALGVAGVGMLGVLVVMLRRKRPKSAAV